MANRPSGYEASVPCFEARNISIADVPAPRSAIWEVLRSPELLAEMTPLIDSISVDGDDWCWQLGGISALGLEVAPAFTERMTFTPETEIRFAHVGTGERAGADGVYTLSDNADGTSHLEIDITLRVDLPLPKLSRRAVEGVMRASMKKTGDAFARRLYAHLGIDPADATQTTVRAS